MRVSESTCAQRPQRGEAATKGSSLWWLVVVLVLESNESGNSGIEQSRQLTCSAVSRLNHWFRHLTSTTRNSMFTNSN